MTPAKTPQPAPLYFDFSDPAEAEMTAAGKGIRARLGDEAAETFGVNLAAAFTKETARLAEEIAENVTGKPFDPVDPDASAHFSQSVYRLRIETARRRARRNSAGLWYAYYVLLNVAGQGKPDTMKLLALRHSAARPIGAEGEESESE